MSNTMTAVETAKKTDTGLREKLQRARTEKDVENTYRFEFQKYLPSALITSPHNTDGVLETETLFVLLEFKYDLDFKSRTDVMKPVVQTLLYLKTFSQAEERIPSAVFVGDKNECFMLPTSALTPYLERSDIEWDTAPSDAWRTLPALYRELILDTAINPYVLDIRERKFYFGNVVERLEAIHKGSVHRVPITIHNISGIFKSWEERVLRGATDPHTAVGAFIQCVLGEAYLHPRKSNTLVVGDTELSVRGDAHQAFFDWFQSEYRVSEKREFTAIKDRLIEEESRRRSGDFYTPAVWAQEAHKMLDVELGENWRDEWIVWDCAAGTANLTRDYQFKELYLSTLFESDVNTIKSMGYNEGAHVFQFDFLNDPIPGEGLFGDFIDVSNPPPPSLMEALRAGKKFVFLINPPFGTAQAGSGLGANKKGVSATRVNTHMKEVSSGMGGASQQLYAQFMYRITEIVKAYDLEDAVFALYSVPLFLSGSSYGNFRSYFREVWKYLDGFVFRSSEFSGTSDAWGCSFTLWRVEREQAR